MGYIIKKVETKELENAFSLIWNTFSEFIAQDYTEEAVVNFRVNFIENEDFKECFKNGNQIMYGAYLNLYPAFLWTRNIIEMVLQQCYLIIWYLN